MAIVFLSNMSENGNVQPYLLDVITNKFSICENGLRLQLTFRINYFSYSQLSILVRVRFYHRFMAIFSIYLAKCLLFKRKNSIHFEQMNSSHSVRRMNNDHKIVNASHVVI
ncbi:hypothetical protein MN116_002277 [Schistosoma mekongi]|uniref:Uncharacterized protein n=1 Tax=Schistosoma mekongi TaxID=38744 RepID=A0AAE1ZK98_SCHME|nr:hypothetical protein MN116_002277 [Schistosoma mekongi]